MFKTSFSEHNKICGVTKRFGANCLRMPHRVCGPGKNRRQKVFHWRPSCLCRGGRHSETLFLIHNMNSISRLCKLHYKYFPANAHDTARRFQLRFFERAQLKKLGRKSLSFNWRRLFRDVVKKCKCKKTLQESRISLIVQLSKHYYRRSKPETGQSMCAAMNVYFH